MRDSENRLIKGQYYDVTIRAKYMGEARYSSDRVFETDDGEEYYFTEDDGSVSFKRVIPDWETGEVYASDSGNYYLRLSDGWKNVRTDMIYPEGSSAYELLPDIINTLVKMVPEGSEEDDDE